LDRTRNQSYLEGVADVRSAEDEPISGTVVRQGYRVAAAEIRGPGDLSYDEILSVVWQVYLRHPIAKRLSQIKRDHILGRGCKPIAEGDPDLQSILDEFWKKNRLDNLLRKFVHQLFLFGDQIFPVAVRKTDGRVRIGYIDPAEVEDVVLHPENALVKCAVVLKERHEDESRPWMVGVPKRRVYYIIRPYEPPPGNGAGDKEDKLLLHDQVEKEPWEKLLLAHYGLSDYTGSTLYWSVNDVANQTRGVSDFHQLVPHLAYLEDVLMTLADRENTAALFAWDLEMEGADELKCKQRANELVLNPPGRGTILVHNERETWKFQSPGMEQAGSIAVEQALLDTVAAGAAIPRSWLGEGGDENRATAREQNRPTWKTLQHDQDELRDDIMLMLNLVRDQAEIAGEWKEPVSEAPLMFLGDTSELGDVLDATPEPPPPTVEPGTITLEMAEVSTLDVQAIAIALERLTVALGAAVEKGWLTKRRSALILSRVLREIGSDYDAEKEFLQAQVEKAQDLADEMAMAEEPVEEPQYRSDRGEPDVEPEPQSMDGTQQVSGARGEEAWNWGGMSTDSATIDSWYSDQSDNKHTPEEISAHCPVCEGTVAYRYGDNHGNAVLCARCGSTFDSVLEAVNA
jgi:hypothetical protein